MASLPMLINAEVTTVVTNDMATQETVLSCINEKVTLGNPRFDDGSDGSYYSVDVTNNLTWPIRAYMFNYTIYGDGRSVPVAEGMRDGGISGGTNRVKQNNT